MDAVPDGNYLAILSLGGTDHRFNLEVDQGSGGCVKTDYQSAQDVRVGFQVLGNGVFLASMPGEDITRSQFWVFRADGKVEIQEIPDCGEKQIAIPVKGDTLEFPKALPIAHRHLLAKLQVAGKSDRLNFKVANDKPTCVAITDPSLAGVAGQFGPIGNCVYVVGLQGDGYRATQFWVFDDEGNATIKELPDRGGDQQAIRVKDARLMR